MARWRSPGWLIYRDPYIKQPTDWFWTQTTIIKTQSMNIVFPFWKTPHLFFSTPKIHPPIPPILALNKKHFLHPLRLVTFHPWIFRDPTISASMGGLRKAHGKSTFLLRIFWKQYWLKIYPSAFFSTQKFTHFKKKHREIQDSNLDICFAF